MYQIQNLTADSRQKQVLVLPSGDQVTIQLYFVPLQLGWFLTSLTYKNFVLNGIRITNSPNILYQWRNQIPFGLACFSQQNLEPMLQQSFLSGASRLFILSQDEVNYYTEFLNGQI